ncbi:MAG TPA: acetyl-CoA carboxylase biotin carboxyl carrier protein [Bryobacteraceae bacterium]|nr:acetyl-CoA carboxylase biotin carboxyl carrier protein [Bryobacteraceae bacterium]
MTADEIRELVQLAVDSGIAELEVQRGENRVRIRRAIAGAGEIAAPPGTLAAHPVTAPAVSAPVPPSSYAAPAGTAAALPETGLVLVKAPIVGTFYESPSPGAPPFVRVGERVEAGKVLCIIESMKLMNEIEAETAGILESKLVENGQPVEYGEALFAIRAL